MAFFVPRCSSAVESLSFFIKLRMPGFTYWRCVVVLLLALVSIFPGCSTAPTSRETSTIPLSYATSRNGLLYYRLPDGWFDATTDAKSAGSVVWLMRDDYAASIVIDEIMLDAPAREAVRHEGLLRLAQLTMSLSSKNGDAVVVAPPDIVTINARNVCVYEMVTASKDRERVILVDADEHVYEVRALAEGTQQDVSAEDIFSVQQDLVKSLRW